MDTSQSNGGASLCARLVYTLPTSLKGRRRQASRSLCGHKKNENLSILVSYPLRGSNGFSRSADTYKTKRRPKVEQ